MPKKAMNEPKMVGADVAANVNAPRKTPKLKLGPGNAWMMASPMRKSREETHPGSTTYDLNNGITIGPPPKITVPARTILPNRLNASEGDERTLRMTMMTINDAFFSVSTVYQNWTSRRLPKKAATTERPSLTGTACICMSCIEKTSSAAPLLSIDSCLKLL